MNTYQGIHLQMQKHQDFLNRRFRRRRGFVLEFWNLGGGKVHDVWVQVTNLQIHNCRYTDKPSKPANQQTRNTSTTTTDTITTQLSVAMGAMGCGDGLYSWLSMVAISNALDGDWLRPRHTPPHSYNYLVRRWDRF